MDVMVAGEDVYTAGTVNGSLIVSAERFQNNGTAGRVEFHRMESRHEEQGQAFSVFGLLMAVGFLVSGLILLRLFPSLFRATEAEMRSSLAWKALGGFLAIIVAMVMIVLMAATFVGLPLAAMLALSLAAALMLSGIFVAHGLGEALASRWSMPEGKWSRFVLGFVLLNILFLLPYIGWLFQIVSASLGVGSILYALQRWQ
jgi:cytochrome b561